MEIYAPLDELLVLLKDDKQTAIKFHKNHTPEDEHDGNGEILYKTLTK